MSRAEADTTPRVAVVIPCFNDGATLPEAVASARAQERCQVVVIDDGSTDPATLGTFERIEAEGVQVLHQPNSGLAAARMAGVHATTARYVFPLDADDVLIEGSLTVLADHLDCHPESGLAWGRYRYLGDKAHEHRTAPSLDPWLITYFNDLPVASMVRRRQLLEAGGWQGAVPGYEDWDLWMSLAERGVRGDGLDLVVYRHRIHGVRMAVSAIPRHGELYGRLERRHPALFAARRSNRRSSDAPWVAKLLLPVIFSVRRISVYRRTSAAAHVVRITTGRVGVRAVLSRRLESLQAGRTAMGSPR
jgi:glycosyltransferase involved in cell wall biosynthesis